MKFEKYIKHHKVVRSMQFELIPVGNTRATIERDHTIEEDRERIEAAKRIKEIADAFYREVLDEFASEASFDWEELYELYQRRETERDKYVRSCEDLKELIAKTLTNFVNNYLKRFLKENGESDAGVNMLSSKFVDVVIPCYIDKHEEYQNEQTERYVQLIKGTSTATFKKYFTGYEKIFCGTGMGSVAGRMIENFEIVCNNIFIYKFNEKIVPGCSGNRELLDVSVVNSLIGQQGIFRYNEMISGSYDSEGKRLTNGYNVDINLYMQKNKGVRLLNMRKAKKQILSMQKKTFLVEKINGMEDFQAILHEFVRIEEEETTLLSETIGRIGEEYMRNGICINPGSLSTASNMYDRWNTIRDIILEYEEETYLADYLASKGRIKKLNKTDKARIEKKVKNKAYTLAEMEILLGSKIRDESITEVIQSTLRKNISYKNVAKENIVTILNKKEKLTTDETRRLRRYLDYVLKVSNFWRLFLLEQRDDDTIYDAEFADRILDAKEKAAVLNDYYNKMRNFVTRKTNDKEERVALCFGRAAHFEQMWKNKQEGKFGNVDAALIEKEGVFYYIVPAAKNTSKLNFPILDSGEDGDYHYLFTRKGGKLAMFGASLTFKSKAALNGYETHEYDEKFEIPCGNGTVQVSKEFYDKYEQKLFRTDRDFLNEVLDLYRKLICIHPGFSNINTAFLRRNEDYPNLGAFCNEVDSMNFSVEKKFLESKKVDEAVEHGNLLMFRISSQDIYKDDEDMKDKYSVILTEAFHCMESGEPSVIINNSPNIYYRGPLIPVDDMHPIGTVLVNKRTDEGKQIPDGVYLSLCEYVNGEKSKEELSYEELLYLSHVITKKSDRAHIKDRRYTKEMFYMQVSCTVNKDVSEEINEKKLNLKVRKDIRENGCNIMSVIRGTDNLLYYYICEPNGKKIEAGPLNIVGDTDYLDKLETLDRIKNVDQRDWVYEMTVSTLKDTYLKMITWEIAKKAIENNCVICIDWISDKVKDKHARFDAQVYKKFEKRLCETLSCYCDTRIERGKPGSVLNPLQLALVDGGTHQNGIIFYTSSAYLKNISPSGFVPSLIDTYNKNSVASKLSFLSRMREIKYNVDEGVFEYSFTISELGSFLSSSELKAYDGANDVWTVMTRKTRSRYDRNKKVRYDYDGTKELKELFKKNNHVSEKIIIKEMVSEEINALYDTFIMYINGYYPKLNGRSSCYFSPVEKWDSLGEIEYDEMSVRNLALKGCIIYNKVIQLDDDDASHVDVEKIEWLNFLKNKKKTVK